MTLSSIDYQERARRFVEQNLLICQSCLVDHLLARGDIPGFRWDDVTNLYDDSMDAIEEYLANEAGLDADDWQELAFDGREALARERGFRATWWGRTCTAQAVYIDHTIARLLRDGYVDA
jgi:hypothetical protein